MDIKELKLNRFYDDALISNAQRRKRTLRTDADGTDLSEFRELSGIEQSVVDFVNEGKSLYIHSVNCGNGKTSWAIRMLQSYFERRWAGLSFPECHGLFISVPRFLRELKENITKKSEYIAHIKENIYAADLVIWDDIATKQASGFDAESLLSMIDARISEGKSNIFTSNLTDDELHLFVGDRLASRIMGSDYNIELHGADKRGLTL